QFLDDAKLEDSVVELAVGFDQDGVDRAVLAAMEGRSRSSPRFAARCRTMMLATINCGHSSSFSTRRIDSSGASPWIATSCATSSSARRRLVPVVCFAKLPDRLAGALENLRLAGLRRCEHTRP